jgi:hypothetical protein
MVEAEDVTGVTFTPEYVSFPPSPSPALALPLCALFFGLVSGNATGRTLT